MAVVFGRVGAPQTIDTTTAHRMRRKSGSSQPPCEAGPISWAQLFEQGKAKPKESSFDLLLLAVRKVANTKAHLLSASAASSKRSPTWQANLFQRQHTSSSGRDLDASGLGYHLGPVPANNEHHALHSSLLRNGCNTTHFKLPRIEHRSRRT